MESRDNRVFVFFSEGVGVKNWWGERGLCSKVKRRAIFLGEVLRVIIERQKMLRLGIFGKRGRDEAQTRLRRLAAKPLVFGIPGGSDGKEEQGVEDRGCGRNCGVKNTTHRFG